MSGTANRNSSAPGKSSSKAATSKPATAKAKAATARKPAPAKPAAARKTSALKVKKVKTSAAAKAKPGKKVDSTTPFQPTVAESDLKPGISMPRLNPPKRRKLGVVQGSDSREVVSESVSITPPWNQICKVRTTFRKSDAEGNVKIGTAWYVMPNVLLTAGHVLFKHDLGGAPLKVEVWSPVSRKWTVVKNYTWTADWQNKTGDYRARDFGAIKTPVTSAGFFELLVSNDPWLLASEFTVAGYAGDKQKLSVEPVLVSATSTVTATYPDRLKHMVDTTPGESGGPLFSSVPNKGIRAVGIHNYGDAAGNFATRITAEVANEIQLWINNL